MYVERLKEAKQKRKKELTVSEKHVTSLGLMGSSATNDPFENRQTNERTNDKQVIQTNTELKFTVNNIHEIYTYIRTKQNMVTTNGREY